MKSNPMMKPKANKKCTKPILNTVWVGCFINTNKDNKSLQKNEQSEVYSCFARFLLLHKLHINWLYVQLFNNVLNYFSCNNKTYYARHE